MSLYSGIAFSGKATPPTEASASPAASTSSTALESTPAPSGSVSSEGDQSKGPTWSAALRFAPVQRARKKVGPAPNAANLNALQNAMASHEESITPAGPRSVGPVKVSSFAGGAATISAAPTVYSASPSTSASFTSSGSKPLGRTIVPPSMTLEEDVNGFKSTSAAKRANRSSKSKRPKQSGARREDPSLSFHPSVVYEVGKPCDYGMYKAHVQQMRIQRRLEMEEERRRGRESEGESYYSSEEEMSDKEDQATAKKARLYAPPTSYDNPPPTNDDSTPSAPAFTPAEPSSGPNTAAASREETGEEAYQRRLAMSAGGGGGIGARSAPPAQAATSFPTFMPASSTAPPAPPPRFRPPPFGRPSSADFFDDSSASPQPPPSFVSSQGSTYSAQPSAPSFVSASTAAPLAPSASPSHAPLNDAAAKAREIAARLSKLGSFGGGAPAIASPPPLSESPQAAAPSEPDTRSFAERQMAAMGWSSGKGLGAQESGMTSALAVQGASSADKKALAKAKASGVAPPSSASGFKGRATVVDSSRAAREQALIDKHGEPSRVVVLTNMVGRGEVDDDLAGEVAEEANKFGVVERCFVHLVPNEWREEDAVRIFLVMSGLAGGWNAVNKFGGRHFGGRVVKARFYEEEALKRGDYSL